MCCNGHSLVLETKGSYFVFFNCYIIVLKSALRLLKLIRRNL